MLLRMFPQHGIQRNNKQGVDNKRGDLGCSGPIPLHAPKL